MPLSKKVVLNNGAEERLGKVEKISVRLKALDPATFTELLMKCKDSNHEIFGKAGEILRGLNLLEKDGSAVDSIKNIVLSSTQEEGGKLTLINPIKKTAVKEIKDVLGGSKPETHNHPTENLTELEEIQKNLFGILSDEEKHTERQRDFEYFIKAREIKEEDYPLIAELYTYANDTFARWFHNTINFHKEKFVEDLERMMPRYLEERPELKRFFEIFIEFTKKYDRTTTHHLNRIMEDKKEYERGLYHRQMDL